MTYGAEKIISLTQMETGQSGVVAGIAGGLGASRRLENMGIRIGKKITKVSGAFLRGPVTVRVGHTQAGIGFGMASKVMVELHT
jgi:ferrous iron transport protein A